MKHTRIFFLKPTAPNGRFSKGANERNYVGSSFNLSWEPDTLNLFTVSFDFGKSLGWQNTRNALEMLSSSGQKQWSYIRDWNSHSSNLGLSGQASYQHTFRRKGHHIVASYLYNNYDNDFSSVQTRHSLEGISLPWLWGKNVNDNATGRHTMQIDYTNPFTSRHTLEAGAKLQMQRSDGNAYPLYGTEYDNMAVAEDEHVEMTQFQDIFALYASYTGTFGSFSGRAGVRWEYTHTGVDYKDPATRIQGLHHGAQRCGAERFADLQVHAGVKSPSGIPDAHIAPVPVAAEPLPQRNVYQSGKLRKSGS